MSREEINYCCVKWTDNDNVEGEVNCRHPHPKSCSTWALTPNKADGAKCLKKVDMTSLCECPEQKEHWDVDGRWLLFCFYDAAWWIVTFEKQYEWKKNSFWQRKLRIKKNKKNKIADTNQMLNNYSKSDSVNSVKQE